MYQGLKYNGYGHYEPEEQLTDGQYQALNSLAKLALIMGFFFICDRYPIEHFAICHYIIVF